MSQSSSSHSPELSALSHNLSDENSGASSSEESNVVKSNLKRKRNEDLSEIVNMYKVQIQMLQDQLSTEIQMQMETLELTIRIRECKIMVKNLESISDLNIREYFRVEQNKIMQKSDQQQQRDEDLTTKVSQIVERISEVNMLQHEDKILFVNLDTISDLNRHEYFRVYQKKIMLTRVQEQQRDEDSSAKEIQDKTNGDNTPIC